MRVNLVHVGFAVHKKINSIILIRQF